MEPLTPSEITFQRLMFDWFETEAKEYILVRTSSWDILHILCKCHYISGGYSRAIGSICEPEISVRLFPLNNQDVKGDRETWIILNGADPEFFTKLITSLDEVHARRFQSSAVRPD